MGIRRICTTEEDFDSGCKDLSNDFLKRGYTQDEVSTHIQKAKDVPRETTLISKEKQALTRIPLVLTYNPTLPPIMESIKKHWHILQSDTSLREIFKELPITSYRRNENIGDILVSNTLRNNQVIRRTSTKKQGKCHPCLTRRNNLCCKHIKLATHLKVHTQIKYTTSFKT